MNTAELGWSQGIKYLDFTLCVQTGPLCEARRGVHNLEGAREGAVAGEEKGAGAGAGTRPGPGPGTDTGAGPGNRPNSRHACHRHSCMMR